MGFVYSYFAQVSLDTCVELGDVKCVCRSNFLTFVQSVLDSEILPKQACSTFDRESVFVGYWFSFVPG